MALQLESVAIIETKHVTKLSGWHIQVGKQADASAHQPAAADAAAAGAASTSSVSTGSANAAVAAAAQAASTMAARSPGSSTNCSASQRTSQTGSAAGRNGASNGASKPAARAGSYLLHKVLADVVATDMSAAAVKRVMDAYATDQAAGRADALEQCAANLTHAHLKRTACQAKSVIKALSRACRMLLSWHPRPASALQPGTSAQTCRRHAGS